MKFPRVNLFLTFDYELPLGGWSVPPDKALIEPTGKLLALCSRLKIPVNFFVDVLSGIQFRKWEPVFEKSMFLQLQSAAQEGHDLQLHLHPHWLTSKYENGEYIPSKDFNTSSFSGQEIKEMVKNGIEYLNTIAQPVAPDYRCVAFRAGGYNVENSNILFDILEKNNVLIDSSMCHGFYFASDQSTVDFRKLPAQANWYFAPTNFRQSVAQGIYEIPIAGKMKTVFEIPTFVKAKIYRKRKPENRGKMIHQENTLSFSQKYRKAFSSRMLSFDNYTYSKEFLLKIVRHNLSKFSASDEINFAVIGHPKGMDQYNFLLMEEFVRSVREIYGEQVRFMTFRQFAAEKMP